ncbi:hypothetical protein THAOC_34542 [Thalassiosira oceanica]|uniref:Myb-like domain-containing protein n=1 Tax=Thalassiosira oceanica TaxID=159749 RepID=K0R2C1_THAOC|nr:hypothetical protein THAOC_34542 [Thalassiosira oceanica]|eukprot:EJK46773.1 hypothetical protein THAOC_34542 [Thalassiosira oceanica]
MRTLDQSNSEKPNSFFSVSRRRQSSSLLPDDREEENIYTGGCPRSDEEVVHRTGRKDRRPCYFVSGHTRVHQALNPRLCASERPALSRPPKLAAEQHNNAAMENDHMASPDLQCGDDDDTSSLRRPFHNVPHQVVCQLPTRPSASQQLHQNQSNGKKRSRDDNASDNDTECSENECDESLLSDESDTDPDWGEFDDSDESLLSDESDTDPDWGEFDDSDESLLSDESDTDPDWGECDESVLSNESGNGDDGDSVASASHDGDIDTLLSCQYDRIEPAGQQCSYCDENARHVYIRRGSGGGDNVCICGGENCRDELLLVVDEGHTGLPTTTGGAAQTAQERADPPCTASSSTESDAHSTEPRRNLPNAYYFGNVRLDFCCKPPDDWQEEGVYPPEWVAVWKEWLVCSETLSGLSTKSGDSLEQVPPFMPWHLRDKTEQRCYAMGLHYAPFELVDALCKVCVDGHPSAVFCEDNDDLVSMTWALVARAFPNLDLYYSAVKYNIEPFYFNYGGSPLDELTIEDYDTVRSAYKPVVKCILRNFCTVLLSYATVDKTKRMFGGKKNFDSLVKECSSNIMSLDSSYEVEAAETLEMSLSHLGRRRHTHGGILTSDHPENLYHKRRPSLHTEQCRRYDAFLGMFIRKMTGNSSHEVTVGRNILQQRDLHGATRSPSKTSASRTERVHLCAVILTGSKTELDYEEAMRMASRIQAKGSRGTPLSGSIEHVLIAGTKALTGIDVSNGEGNDHVVKRCTKTILSSLMRKPNETQQGTWNDEEIRCVIDLEKKLHCCRNRFELISLAVPGKSPGRCRRKWEREMYERLKQMVEGGTPLTAEQSKVYERVKRGVERENKRRRDERAEYKRLKQMVEGGTPLTAEQSKVYERVKRRVEREKKRQRDERAEYNRLKQMVEGGTPRHRRAEQGLREG